MTYQAKLFIQAKSRWLLNDDKSQTKTITLLLTNSIQVLFTFKKNKNMERNLQKLSNDKDEMVSKGQIIEAAEKYFASNVKTIDFDGSVTEGKQETMKRLNEFVGSIQKVNEITLRRSASHDDAAFAEYIFSFEMKDGSKIYWHEIIRSLWKNGQIVEEQYFSYKG